MGRHKKQPPQIDPEFKGLIPPLNQDEYNTLEMNIIRDGCREAIITWNNVIIDGHNRYEICTRHQIPFRIKAVHFNNREEALAWICYNQLGRRNITEETRKYLIGKRYEMEKSIGMHNKSRKTGRKARTTFWDGPESEPAYRTSERLGDVYRISKNTVQKYGRYTAAMEQIRSKAPKYVPMILNGSIKISQENLALLAEQTSNEITRICESLLEDKTPFIRYTQTREAVAKISPSDIKQIQSDYLSAPIQENKPVTVKDPPAYDPDAELSSLAFTMPSWASSIDRAIKVTNFSAVTNETIHRLKKSISSLQISIDAIQSALKEVF